MALLTSFSDTSAVQA